MEWTRPIKRGRILLVAMPFDSGWTATVDGTAAKLFKADYGLTALWPPSGQHQIELHYAVPGRAIGTWLLLASLVILLGIGMFRMSTRKRLSNAFTSHMPYNQSHKDKA